jgi:hypothetical protein
MNEKLVSLFKPHTEVTLEYAQQMTEDAMQFLLSQMAVTENVFMDVSRECRELLASSAEPATMLNSLPAVMKNTTRSTTAGADAILKNVIGYQAALIQMMQNRVPEIRRQFSQSLLETARSAATAGAAAIAAAAPQGKAGRGNGFRPRKAA